MGRKCTDEVSKKYLIDRNWYILLQVTYFGTYTRLPYTVEMPDQKICSHLLSNTTIFLVVEENKNKD